jgi:hypothetical protein
MRRQLAAAKVLVGWTRVEGLGVGRLEGDGKGWGSGSGRSRAELKTLIPSEGRAAPGERGGGGGGSGGGGMVEWLA